MRLINRLLAALAALGLAVLGALIVIEVVAQRLSDRPVVVTWHHIYAWAARTSPTQGSVRVTCIVLAVTGLLLLVFELKPSRPRRLTTESADTDTAYTRRGVAVAIGHAVGDVDGINHVAVTVRRHRIRVHARTAGLQPYTAQTLTDPVQQAAHRRLDELELRPAPRLHVQVRTRSR
ncbi:MAG: alkaline shock response membrane anchor protein AmaP [Gordonia polyisoprenivorans]|nr:alkaline shock response membrane anchor protein AmaP [Gordonia polyisoprenivorans]